MGLTTTRRCLRCAVLSREIFSFINSATELRKQRHTVPADVAAGVSWRFDPAICLVAKRIGSVYVARSGSRPSSPRVNEAKSLLSIRVIRMTSISLGEQ